MTYKLLSKLIAVSFMLAISNQCVAEQFGGLDDDLDDDIENSDIKSGNLHDHIMRGNTESAIKLITAGVDLNTKNYTRMTPLELAIEENQTQVVQALLAAGAKINLASNGWHPLHNAASKGNADIVKALLAAGTDVNAKDFAGRTPLCIAIVEGNNTAVVQELLKAPNININEKDSKGRTPLYIAAESGRTVIVEELLRAPNIKVNEKDDNGFTALHGAAGDGRTAIVEKLLAVPGVNVNATSNTGWTPLHCAAAWHREKVIRALLGAKANANAKDKKGHTPLDAAKNGQPWQFFDSYKEVAELLKAHGATSKIKSTLPRSFCDRTPCAV